MARNLYNGKREGVSRVYNSLKFFVGENAIYPPGEVLCVSVRNNDEYKLFITADGKSRFLELYKKATEGGGGSGGGGGEGSEFPKIIEEADGTLRIVVK